MDRKTAAEKLAHALSKKLADEGRLIEGGFAAFMMLVVPPGTPPQQVTMLRLAYMAGAQHLFGSIMGMMDPGIEPTEADEKRMDLISDELNKWHNMISQASKGNA